MLQIAVTPITYDDFRAVLWEEPRGARSSLCRPISGETARQGVCSLDQFLALSTYPVWYLGPDGGDFNHHTSPDYHRILFRDALKLGNFRDLCSIDRYPENARRTDCRIILLHCRTCNHAAVIDGNHRITRLALGLEPQMDRMNLTIVVLSGTKWSADTPDMNKVCACLTP